MVEMVKNIFLIVSALFPIVNPLGGAAPSFCRSRGNIQRPCGGGFRDRSRSIFFLAPWLIPVWNVCSRLSRDFFTGGPDRGRIDGNLQRLGDAEDAEWP